MSINNQKIWTLFSVFGFAYWFFGNLYEAIVFGPNWVIKDSNHLKLLNDFFINSNPTLYFIPMTLLATISVWVLTLTNKVQIVKRDYRIASVFALIVTLLTSFIVGFVLSKMFGSGFFENPAEGSFYGNLWNILNAFRLVLEVITIYYLFNVYRKLDKL
jgi:hypothetical protein